MSSTVAQRPGRLDLELVKGDDASLELTFADTAADPVDLSGRAWSLRIAGPGLYVELDSAVDTTDEATGVLVVPFAAATTAAIGRDVTWSLRDTTNKRTLLDGELRAYVAGHAGAGSSSIEQTVTITNATAAVTVTAAVVGGGGVALGETSTTAYRGDRGKTAYDHSQVTTGNPHGTTAADIGAAATSHTHTGTQVTVDASGFNGNLTTSDDTVQEVAQKLDDLVIPAAYSDEQAQDAVAAALVTNGVHSGLTAAYVDATPAINLTVTPQFAHRYVDNQFYLLAQTNDRLGGATAFTPGTNAMAFWLLVVERTIQVDGLWFYLQATAASSKMRFGIWAPSATTGLATGSPLVTSAEVDASVSPGYRSQTFTPVTLTPGAYWGGVAVVGAATYRTWTAAVSAPPIDMGGPDSSTSVYWSFNSPWTYGSGALPDVSGFTFTPQSGTLPPATGAPYVRWRVQIP